MTERKPKKRTTTALRKRIGGDRRSWKPTDDERLVVQACAAEGFTHEQIAGVLKVDCDTLTKHCKEELSGARVAIDGKIAGKLVSKCLDGDLGSIVWYEKTRRGMRDTSRHELTGPDGGPIDARSVTWEITSEMSPAQAAEAYQKLLG